MVEPSGPLTGASARARNSAARGRSSGRARMPSRPRESDRSAMALVPRPLKVMPAAASCSCSSRAYGTSPLCSTAIRCAGTARWRRSPPGRSAAPHRRSRRRGSPGWRSAECFVVRRVPPPRSPRTPTTAASALWSPVRPANTVTSVWAASARANRGSAWVSRCGRYNTMRPHRPQGIRLIEHQLGGRGQQIGLVVEGVGNPGRWPSGAARSGWRAAGWLPERRPARCPRDPGAPGGRR